LMTLPLLFLMSGLHWKNVLLTWFIAGPKT
jgi:hypothetical protein